MRNLWLTSHLLDDAEGAAADSAARDLGPAVHARLLEAADDLAAVSAVLAQTYYRRAAAVWTAFGPKGFRRWFELGAALAAADPPCREGATAFFSVAPEGFGRAGLDNAESWCALARPLGRVSPKLAALFLAGTAPVLRHTAGASRLAAWAEVALELHRQSGWQAEMLAQHFLGAAPAALLAFHPGAYRLWAGAAASLAPVDKGRDCFRRLPRGVRRWSETEQVLFLRATIALAGVAVKEAFVFYRELPASLAGLDTAARTALLGVLAAAAKRLAGEAGSLASVAGALVRQVPASSVLDALAQLQRVAESCPEAVAAALRALPRIYEDADPERVREWFAAGLRIAAENREAALAFFAVESRTSLKVLRATSTAVTLDEAQGVMRKYITMLSGAPASLRTYDTLSLRPALEECPLENEIALPLRVDLCSTHEENLRLYRFLAAQLAGRRLFGTYEFLPPGVADGESPAAGALVSYLRAPERPDALEELFMLADGVRVAARLAAEFRGLAGEGRWLAERWLARWAQRPAPARSEWLDGIFALVVGGGDRPLDAARDRPLDAARDRPLDAARDRPRPGWLASAAVERLVRLVAPLAAPGASAADALRVAEALAVALAAAAPAYARGGRELEGDQFDRLGGDALFDPYLDEGSDDAAAGAAAPKPAAAPGGEAAAADEQVRLELSADAGDGSAGALPLSPEELKRLIDAGANLRIGQGEGGEVEGLGLYITDLIGKLPSEQLDELRERLLEDRAAGPRRAVKHFGETAGGDAYFAYDEWDYHIDDYRSRWCHLYEMNVDGDSGEFFTQALTDYARLIPEIRRQFQRLRPERYRVVRGLEHGEDFDLNAAIAARADLRAGLAPSSRLYLARQREERDVATLFLIDMSASTDEPLVPNGGRGRPARRIIDLTKETLVIMAEALEEIGDAYSIYGFSGHGRERVEVYRVKSFAENLTSTVKGRLGGIEPKRSTRMGAALRHSVEKLAGVTARSKHIFLLSDGFPQDYDYGQDRRSNTYGIRDTAVALREAEAAGITPFCITVDKAGHDYLRQMCDESRYMVIEDITALPRELPKVYQRIVRA